MLNEKERSTHPSFGMISFTRTQGSARFYGSELEQDHYITMELHNSSVDKELSHDWYRAEQLLARVRMSAGQFSEMITNMNRGNGVCCTIEIIDKQRMPELPEQESKKEFTHRKFKERMTIFANTIREQKNKALELVKKKTLSKEEMRQLQLHLNWLTQEIEGNIPFFAECFQETVDDIVFDAKMEVENAIQHKINILGLNALHEHKILSEKITKE